MKKFMIRCDIEGVSGVVMIEPRRGVENIDAILAVDGVDGGFIGPYDLSGSCGVPGQTAHELVQGGCRRVRDACRHAGKAAGIHVVTPDPSAIARAVADGYTFLALGVDTVFLGGGATAAGAPLSECRRFAAGNREMQGRDRIMTRSRIALSLVLPFVGGLHVPPPPPRRRLKP